MREWTLKLRRVENVWLEAKTDSSLSYTRTSSGKLLKTSTCLVCHNITFSTPFIFDIAWREVCQDGELHL